MTLLSVIEPVNRRRLSNGPWLFSPDAAKRKRLAVNLRR
jgi:hypothetical protein